MAEAEGYVGRSGGLAQRTSLTGMWSARTSVVGTPGDPHPACRSSAKAMAGDILGCFPGRETRLSVCLGIAQVGQGSTCKARSRRQKRSQCGQPAVGAAPPPSSPESSESRDLHASLRGRSAWTRDVSQRLLGDTKSRETAADMGAAELQLHAGERSRWPGPCDRQGWRVVSERVSRGLPGGDRGPAPADSKFPTRDRTSQVHRTRRFLSQDSGSPTCGPSAETEHGAAAPSLWVRLCPSERPLSRVTRSAPLTH